MEWKRDGEERDEVATEVMELGCGEEGIYSTLTLRGRGRGTTRTRSASNEHRITMYSEEGEGNEVMRHKQEEW